MAYFSSSRRPRVMVDLRHLDLICSVCGKAIAELPFEPALDRPLFCQDCHQQRKPGSRPY